MIPNLPDYYALLGVSSTATPEECKQGWRARAFALHPDRNPGSDGAAFRQAAEAWEILGDAGRRARYDSARVMPWPEPRPSPGRPSPWAQPSPPWRDVSGEARERERRDRERQAADARFRAEQQAARRRAYEVEQMDLEEAVGSAFGDWTRFGVMRTGDLGRRRRAIGVKDRKRVDPPVRY